MAAGLRFHTEAGLLTSFITALPFPVSQWIARPLPYTVTASFRIRTGFPFHLLLSRHLCATTLYFFQTSVIISYFVELSMRCRARLFQLFREFPSVFWDKRPQKCFFAGSGPKGAPFCPPGPGKCPPTLKKEGFSPLFSVYARRVNLRSERPCRRAPPRRRRASWRPGTPRCRRSRWR